MIIDQLPEISAVQETDEIPVERGTATYKSTLQKLKDLVASLLTKSDVGLGNVDNVRQYSEQNAPPYPVTSVNGQTGDVAVQAATDAQVATAVNTWLGNNVDPATGYVLDSTLTMSNAAPPASAVGELKSALTSVNDGYYSYDVVPNKYILRGDGQESNYNGWSATGFIPLPPHSLVISELPTGTDLPWGALYDENKDYIEARSWNTYSELTYFNATDTMRYTRTSGANNDIANLKFKILPIVDETLTKRGYSADAKAVGDALDAISKGKDVIPSYYVSQLVTKETAIRGHFDDCAYNGDGLIFLTDTHFSADLFTSATPTSYVNANNSFSLIADIFKKCAVDKIAFGGDLVSSTPDVDTMLLCIASFGTRIGNRQNRLRYCVGNHEYYTGDDMGATTKPTPSMLYGAGVKYNEDVVLGKGDMVTYYFDNILQKIRYFVISCGRDTELTIPQVEWVLNEFKSIPSDYHVVLIGHGFMTDDMTGFRGRYQQIANALDKIKAKSSISYNGTTYDYSTLNNVTPVCMITGHVHIDGSLVTSGGIPCISTTTDSYAQNYELVNGTPTKVERTKGTVDEQAFDVYQFDFTNRKIYVTRIGYGSDREFSY